LAVSWRLLVRGTDTMPAAGIPPIERLFRPAAAEHLLRVVEYFAEVGACGSHLPLPLPRQGIPAALAQVYQPLPPQLLQDGVYGPRARPRTPPLLQLPGYLRAVEALPPQNPPIYEVIWMECKECKVVCDGKELATVDCGRDGLSVRWSKDCNDKCEGISKGCC
jgi:hypothetical protein